MTVSKHYTEQVAGAGHMPMVTLLVWSSVIVQTRLHTHTVLHAICIVRYIIFLYNYRFFCSFFVLYKIFCIVAYIFIIAIHVKCTLMESTVGTSLNSTP